MQLGAHEVHVWRQALDISARGAARLRAVLSTDEISRANAFRFEVDCNRFAVARGYLRTILSLYLLTDPAKIEFTYSTYGKPSIVAPNASEVCFNLAHSAALAVYAVTRNRDIGVDLEMVCSDFDRTEIAERFFASNEAAHLRSLPDAEQERAFFMCWTRKEALLKAKGVGLSQPLNEFQVIGELEESTGFLKTRGDTNEFAGWSMKTIDLRSDYVAAIAVKGNDWNLSYWQMPEDND
jgi:4'-phosphopantetheinyl transferase